MERYRAKLGDIEDYKYDGINMSPQDYKVPELQLYNGPIDPKDANNYEEYHNKAVQD